MTLREMTEEINQLLEKANARQLELILRMIKVVLK